MMKLKCDSQTDLVADWPPANSRVAFTIKGEENTLNYFSTNSIKEKCLIFFTTSLSTEPLGCHKKNLRWRSTSRRPQCRSCTFTCHSQFGDEILRWRTWSTFVPTFSESFSVRSHWAERELRAANVQLFTWHRPAGRRSQQTGTRRYSPGRWSLGSALNLHVKTLPRF